MPSVNVGSAAVDSVGLLFFFLSLVDEGFGDGEDDPDSSAPESYQDGSS
jgi:hypothetical protein